MGRGPICKRNFRPFPVRRMPPYSTPGISTGFPVLSQSYRQVIHALLTRPPLILAVVCINKLPLFSVRLACVRHAASVRPEPGSNSPYNLFADLARLFSFQRPVSSATAFPGSSALYLIMQTFFMSRPFSTSFFPAFFFEAGLSRLTPFSFLVKCIIF